MIGEGKYTREQAVEALQEMRSALDNPISYLYFKTLVQDRVDKYPGLLEAGDIYLSSFASMSQIMCNEDREFLIGFIDKVIEGVK